LTPNDLAMDLHHVAKTYKGKVRALRGIEMQVRRGEIFGLLGPNGAGKSTLVKIMMTIVRPNRADGTVLGRRIGHKATLARTGYLPENGRFPRYLTARQAVEHYGALANVPRRERKRRTGELLETVGMTDWANKRIAGFSKGMVQRIALAQALVNDPELVLLDEPTDGVDPVGRRGFRDVLRHLRDEGRTVFLNSHMLGEVEMVCDRVAILVEGRVVRQGSLDELTAGRTYYEIELHGDAPAAAGGAAVAAIGCELSPSGESLAVATGGGPRSTLRGRLDDGCLLELEGDRVRVGTADPRKVHGVLVRLVSAGLVVRSLRPVRQSLEDLFIETVSAGNAGQEGGGR
jgi:ABC-2 type transport system ATP-binding protein